MRGKNRPLPLSSCTRVWYEAPLSRLISFAQGFAPCTIPPTPQKNTRPLPSIVFLHLANYTTNTIYPPSALPLTTVLDTSQTAITHEQISQIILLTTHDRSSQNRHHSPSPTFFATTHHFTTQTATTHQYITQTATNHCTNQSPTNHHTTSPPRFTNIAQLYRFALITVSVRPPSLYNPPSTKTQRCSLQHLPLDVYIQYRKASAYR